MAAIGGRFGSYVIDRELGRGGMGVVYAARHEILGHTVALKVLHTELSERGDIVERFFNEARAAAAIDHPNIVGVHDVGFSENHEAFLVMELLAGESLAHRLKVQGPMPVGAAMMCTRQICEALDAAHARGIVHRDLKPDNIFLVDDPEAAFATRALLLDFGVAKLTGELRSKDLRTQTGALLGTPYYMSPEQCDGEREIDPRSDLYSLGCVLFQMIGGRLMFEGGIGGVIGMHLHVQPPPLRAVMPSCPEEIEAIITQLVAKSPSDRFQTARALIGAIDATQFCWHRQPSMPPEFWKPITHNPTPPPPSEKNAPTLSTNPAIDVNAPTQLPPKPKEPAPAQSVPVPRSNRAVLVAGVAVGMLGLGGGAFFALRSTEKPAANPDAAVAMKPVEVDAFAKPVDEVEIDAAAPIDAAVVIATAPRDAGTREAKRDAAAEKQAPARDADVAMSPPPPADAAVAATQTPDDAKPAPRWKRPFEAHMKSLEAAELDWEASREYLILEAAAPQDARLKEAKTLARRLINKFAKDPDHTIIHLAIVDHAWEKGLENCRANEGDWPNVRVHVQCLVHACVVGDKDRMKKWGGLPEQSLHWIGAFCELHAKW